MEHTAAVTTDTEPADVRIIISPSREGYDLVVFADEEGPFTGPISMSMHDVASLNKQFVDKAKPLLKRVLQIYKANYKATEAELEKEIYPLASLGWHAFIEVFKAESVLSAIEPLFTSGRTMSIQISAEEFALPWELLYPVDPKEQEWQYENFWGMNFVIQRYITNAEPKVKRPLLGPIITINHRPKVGLLTNDTLTNVVDKEIPYFRGLGANKKIDLVELEALEPSDEPRKRQQELEKYEGFWEAGFNLAHFACHASYNNSSPNESRFLLTKEFPVTLMDMTDNREFVIKGYPLVILNACETGYTNPLFTMGFAKTFFECGARGVVGTECLIPDAFAADFAQELYRCLLGGNTLGKSLLETRQHFFFNTGYKNPAGLLYSLYAPPSTRLEKTR
jgi:hypothetical protein